MRPFGLVLVLAVPLAAAAAMLRPRPLLALYLRTVRRMRVPEDRGEAIASYPMA